MKIQYLKMRGHSRRFREAEKKTQSEKHGAQSGEDNREHKNEEIGSKEGDLKEQRISTGKTTSIPIMRRLSVEREARSADLCTL